MNFRSSVEYYVSKGFSFLPAGRDKRPLLASWAEFQKRRPTPAEIQEWGRDHPDANIALVCGQLSDLTAVDCDNNEAVLAVEELIPDTLEVPTTTTPRKGKHFYFKFTPGLYSRNGTAAGLDVKSEGGYVLVPPSRTDKGEYIPGPIRIEERPAMPRPLFDRLKKGQATPAGSPAVAAQASPLTQGRRDEDLFHMALQLFKDKHPREEVERIVLAAAKAAVPPFPERETRAKIESAWKRIQNSTKSNEEGVVLFERDPRNVIVRPIPYISRDVLPTHMATTITGNPGDGKSLVTTDWTARITSGTAFPVYTEAGKAVCGHVFYVTSEGVPEMILVPRLMAAGADLGKLTIIEGIMQRDGEFSMFDVTKHLPMIAARARDFDDLKMIVIDPVASFIPERINTGQQNQVRQMMDKISDLAYKLGVAAVPVMHFSKTPGLAAGHRTSGSVQFAAAVKMSWSVIRREGGDRNLRLLVPQKSNITGGQKSMSFHIQEVRFPAPSNPKETIVTARIKYGELVDEDPEKLISPPIENDSHVANAKRFLLRKLAEGTTLYAKPLIDKAEENGVPKWALYKAKDRLGVQHDKEGTYQGRTFWFMPKEK